MKALLVLQAFPPLFKNAGGVSKRYLTLCRALIDGLGWQVTLMTPVNVRDSREPDVLRWLGNGSLVHLPARGVRIQSAADGVAVFCDLFSFVSASQLITEMCLRRGYDLVFTDDVPWRIELLLLCRAMAVPAIITTHTDITHMKSFKGVVKMVWAVHILAAHFAAVHATVSRIFAKQLSTAYKVPVNGVWPPILWSADFRSEPQAWIEQVATQRAAWLEQLHGQGCTPKAIMLYVGRWSAEKRIHLIYEALPRDCALVILGDGTSEYATMLEKAGPASGRSNVLSIRKMLGAKELRIAYAASDLFVSASNFETLGNTVIESFCSGTPCAVQPAQGHLEFIEDGKNSWFVNYDDTDAAKEKLSQIVAWGLAPSSLEAVLPEFAAMGQWFRSADFAKELEKELITPALAVGRRQRTSAISEMCKRVAAFIACVLIWPMIRALTRFFFVMSREPIFEVLGKLGGADDSGKGASIWTLPCVRALFALKCEERNNEPELGTDYESHYKLARHRKPSKSEQIFELLCWLGILMVTLSCLYAFVTAAPKLGDV